MDGERLDHRLISQLAPLAPLLDRLIDAATTEATEQRAADAFPGLRRPAHLRRLSGLARWGEVADGLVASSAAGALPDGFSVVTSEAQHNRGQYIVRFPGGVLTFRRSPHDDAKEEGVFLQQQFDEIVELLDEQGAPSATELVRVWVSIEAGGRRDSARAIDISTRQRSR